MPSITIKDLPRSLHRALKVRAQAHHRSLNKEIIATLELSTVGSVGADTEMMIEEARATRRKFARTVRESEISRWKRQGRV